MTKNSKHKKNGRRKRRGYIRIKGNSRYTKNGISYVKGHWRKKPSRKSTKYTYAIQLVKLGSGRQTPEIEKWLFVKAIQWTKKKLSKEDVRDSILDKQKLRREILAPKLFPKKKVVVHKKVDIKDLGKFVVPVQGVEKWENWALPEKISKRDASSQGIADRKLHVFLELGKKSETPDERDKVADISMPKTEDGKQLSVDGVIEMP